MLLFYTSQRHIRFLTVLCTISLVSCFSSSLDLESTYHENSFFNDINDLLSMNKIDSFTHLKLQYFYFNLKSNQALKIWKDLNYAQVIEVTHSYIPLEPLKEQPKFTDFDLQVRKFKGLKDSLCINISLTNLQLPPIENIELSFDLYDFTGELIHTTTITTLEPTCHIVCLERENELIPNYNDKKKQFLMEKVTYSNLIKYSSIQIRHIIFTFKNELPKKYIYPIHNK